MNRHGYHNEHELYEEDAEEGNVEMPLPTYEEVVGASNHNIGFKADLLAPGPSHQGSRAACSGGLARQRASAPNAEAARTPSYRRKNCAKNYIVGLTGIVLIPLLILLVVLQLKSCNSCEHALDNKGFNVEELDICNIKLQRTERQYSDVLSKFQGVEKKRKELLKQLQSADIELKDLRYMYDTEYTNATYLRMEVNNLKKDLEEYKAKVLHMRENLPTKNDT